MFFVSLKSQPNHRMEFTLKGMPFDSLRVVAYDNTKNEIVHFPCRLTWIFRSILTPNSGHIDPQKN